MPAPGQLQPTSLASAIRLYLLTHPGPLRAVDLADALRVDDRQRVSKECQRLARKGALVKVQIDNPDYDGHTLGQRPKTSAFRLSPHVEQSPSDQVEKRATPQVNPGEQA